MYLIYLNFLHGQTLFVEKKISCNFTVVYYCIISILAVYSLEQFI